MIATVVDLGIFCYVRRELVEGGGKNLVRHNLVGSGISSYLFPEMPCPNDHRDQDRISSPFHFSFPIWSRMAIPDQNCFGVR